MGGYFHLLGTDLYTRKMPSYGPREIPDTVMRRCQNRPMEMQDESPGRFRIQTQQNASVQNEGDAIYGCRKNPWEFWDARYGPGRCRIQTLGDDGWEPREMSGVDLAGVKYVNVGSFIYPLSTMQLKMIGVGSM
jgi:hypothetical protein